MTALLQLPFVAAVVVQVALVGLPQEPALHANVADPLRHDLVFVKVTLEPELALLAFAEQPLPHSSVVAEQPLGAWQSAVVPPHAASQRHLMWVSVLGTFLYVPCAQLLTCVPHAPFSGALPVQFCVCAVPGLGVGHSVLPQGQVTVRVPVLLPRAPQAVALHSLHTQSPISH